MPASTSRRLRSGTASASVSVTWSTPSSAAASATPRAPASSLQRLVRAVDADQDARPAAAAELLERAHRDDLALVDDRHLVARLLDLVEDVRREHHRASLVDERAEQAAELEDAGGVEAVHRLVEDQQLRVGEQAARDAEALAHPHRVRLDAVVRAVGQADALERGVDARERLAAARRGDDAEVLASREVAVEARLLDDRADARERLGAPLGHRQPAQAHRAAVRAREAEQDSDERRLAGAVRAEVAERDAARDAEVDALDEPRGCRSASSGRSSR